MKQRKDSYFPIQQVLNNWKNLFPWYDGDEKDDPRANDEDYSGNGPAPYFDYNFLGNGLTYFPKQKALKIILANHRHIQYSKIKEGTPKELKQKLGKPAKVLNNELNYFFSTPFGTIEFLITGFYGTITCIYLYPVQPAAVVQAEP